ncbi:MAG: GxxExxY protein [Gloeobacteraceae cyanobacterium ES-bin-316]|nr:GxxExxY protein [Ferruginibacter sp.]
MIENEISYIIRGSILKVYRTLGPGLFENVYKHVLKYEIEKAGLPVMTEVPLPVVYDNQKFDIGFKIDLLVADRVIIELKSIERISEVHHKQVITYLRLSDKKLGILVNFNTDTITDNIFRKVNQL